jgi:mannitol/fructose-specific phosphotransferase system IIA component (Ntr-type)
MGPEGEGIVPEQLIFTGLTGKTAAEVLAAIARRLAEAGAVADPEGLTRDLVAREARCSTALGGGIAVPHGRLTALSEPVVALGFVSPPADFGAPDATPVDLVFLLLSPADSPARHLSLLARLSRILRSPGIGAQLRAAEGPAAAVRALREAEAGLMVSSR